MPKKVKDDSDDDYSPKKKKTKTKKTKKGISIKNKNKNKIIININSGRKGKKEKVQKIMQTQTRPPISIGTTLISGNPIDKNYEIELSKLRNQVNELNNNKKTEEPRRENISINPPNQSNFILDNLKRGALGVGNYILQKASDSEGYVIKKVTNRIDNLESVVDSIGSKIIHKAADGTISLLEKSVNGLINLGSYTLSKTGEGLNILLKSTIDSYSTPAATTTDPTLQQMNFNFTDTVDDPTLNETNLTGNSGNFQQTNLMDNLNEYDIYDNDDDLPPLETDTNVNTNDLINGYAQVRQPIPINKDDENDDDSIDDVPQNIPVRVPPKYFNNINVSNIEKLMGRNRNTPSFKQFLSTNGLVYDNIKTVIDQGSKKDAAEYIRKLILDNRNQQIEPETNENPNDESFSLQDLTLSQMVDNNPEQQAERMNISLVTPSQDNSPIFRNPEESESLLSSYYQPVINENDQNEEPPEMSSLIQNNIDSEIIPIVEQPPEQAEEEPQQAEEPGQTAKPKGKGGRPKGSTNKPKPTTGTTTTTRSSKGKPRSTF